MGLGVPLDPPVGFGIREAIGLGCGCLWWSWVGVGDWIGELVVGVERGRCGGGICNGLRRKIGSLTVDRV